MSEFTIEQATRTGVNPLIDLYSESGCGKTMSALLLARGLAGPDGLIVGVDTESRRMSLYADVIPGGFKVINFAEPFAPSRYIGAINAAYELKPACVVVDSLSHGWEGIGGVCDLAAKAEEKSGKAGLHNWKGPKTEHQHLVQFLLRAPVPIICCLRAKYKTRQTKGTAEAFERGEIEKFQIGRTIIQKSDQLSPIQSDDFLFEATVHMQILQDHTVVVTKCNHPDLRKCFPEDKTRPITIEDGVAIARWCKQLGGVTASKPAAPVDDLKAAKARLWEVLKPVRGDDKTWATGQKWLRDNDIILIELSVSSMTIEQLNEAAKKAAEKLAAK